MPDSIYASSLYVAKRNYKIMVLVVKTLLMTI